MLRKFFMHINGRVQFVLGFMTVTTTIMWFFKDIITNPPAV